MIFTTETKSWNWRVWISLLHVTNTQHWPWKRVIGPSASHWNHCSATSI